MKRPFLQVRPPSKVPAPCPSPEVWQTTHQTARATESRPRPGSPRPTRCNGETSTSTRPLLPLNRLTGQPQPRKGLHLIHRCGRWQKMHACSFTTNDLYWKGSRIVNYYNLWGIAYYCTYVFWGLVKQKSYFEIQANRWRFCTQLLYCTSSVL